MDTISAFAMGFANRGKELKVFDWDKAAQLIKESGCHVAEAGLRDDWEWTSGIIYDDGIVTNDYTYLASTWATPIIVLDENDYDEIECYKMKHEVPEWDADTKWPKSAMEIIERGTV